MHPNELLIEKFYSSFQKGDYVGMLECYHPNVQFSDPVFQTLSAAQAQAMWEMLVTRGKDLTLSYKVIQADDESGHGYWEASYTFSRTGRKVLNKVNSSFRFKDGKIIEHHDTFDIWKWAGMALGPSGRLMGWSPPVKKAIRKQALAGLDEFMVKQSANKSAAK